MRSNTNTSHAPGAKVRFTWNSFEAYLFYGVIFINLALIADVFSRAPNCRLTMEMSASRPSVAQLFYDVGRGFNEQDSATAQITSNSLTSFQHLTFLLPEKKLLGLRFDPLTNEGRVIIRKVVLENRNTVLKTFPVSQITSFNQIANRTERGNEVEFSTVSGANDPGLRILTGKPIRLRGGFASRDFLRLGIMNGCLVCPCLLLLASKRKIRSIVGKLLQVVQTIAGRFPDGSFLNVDAFAVLVYIGLITCFCLACILDLNGSSAGMYSLYGNGPAAKILMGSPRAFRSDEWAYSTPDVLNQYFRADRFAVPDSVLGNHNIALTGNIPVKHLSTLFRPQFWSFFVLPADYAYSAYWQMKALLLVGGTFTLLLMLTGSSRWALTGALWYFFSPFIQWSYSWPSAMPEMVGLLCLGTVCFCYLITGRSARWLWVSAAGAAFCGVDFAMCAYLPHLIPLAWVGAAIVLAWCAARRAEVFSKEVRGTRIAAILFTGAVWMGIGLTVYESLRPAITAVSETLYPGRRVLSGGTLPVWAFASHFLQWTEDESRFPALLSNICEGSGFLWLAPVALLCVPRLSLAPFGKAALAALWICFLTIFCWCAFPLPAQFGRITGLDLSTGARCLPALGLANVGIVMLTMAGFKRKPWGRDRKDRRWRQAAYLLGGWVIFLLILRAANQHLGNFFSTAEIVLASLFSSFLSMLLITRESRLLALCLVIPQALAFGLTNPVERGIREFTQSDLNRFVQGHRELLHGRWLVYSNTPVRSGFVASSGCEVYTGTRYLPDIDHFAAFAQRGLDLNIFNRLGYLDARPIVRGEPTRFVQAGPLVVEWDVAPSDPLLKTVGIRYVAFDAKPEPKFTEGLSAVADVPVDGLWIYRLPGT
jgi:hypothetical protein